MSTNVPAIQWTPTGIVVPTQAAILAGAIADFNAAFGGNLNPALNTPQGQLASALAAIIANANTAIANLVNGVNPPTSSGSLQDAIGYLYFMTRNPAVSTVVVCTCVGLAGTVIPVGAQAQDTSGNVYVCTAQVTIPVGGSITTTFANAVTGPIACPANTVTTIYQQIPGWDTVNNIGAGILGSNVETPAAFEFRRQQSIAANSQGAVQSVYGALFGSTNGVANVPGLVDAYVYENATSAAVSVGATSYSVAKNAIYVAAYGGVAATIANLIWSKKSPGCNTVGNTPIVVTDTNYSLPQPSYTINFNTPTTVPIYFAVTLASNTGLPGNYKTLIQNAIIAQFLGTTGSTRARIGSAILASNFYGPVINLGPLYQVTSVFVGQSASPSGTSTTMGIDQMPTITAANITVSP